MNYKNGYPVPDKKSELVKQWNRKTNWMKLRQKIENEIGLDINLDISENWNTIKSIYELPPVDPRDSFNYHLENIFNAYISKKYNLLSWSVGLLQPQIEKWHPEWMNALEDKRITDEFDKILDKINPQIEKIMSNPIRIADDRNSAVICLGRMHYVDDENTIHQEQIMYYIFRGNIEGYNTNDWMISAGFISGLRAHNLADDIDNPCINLYIWPHESSNLHSDNYDEINTPFSLGKNVFSVPDHCPWMDFGTKPIEEIILEVIQQNLHFCNRTKTDLSNSNFHLIPELLGVDWKDISEPYDLGPDMEGKVKKAFGF